MIAPMVEESLASNLIFDEVTRVVTSNFEEHNSKMKEYCVKKSLASISDFNEVLQKEFKDIETNTASYKGPNDPLEFTKLFNAFDKFPTNLPKPKSVTVKGSARSGAGHSTSRNDTSNTSVNLTGTSTETKHLPAAVQYKDFVKYVKKLEELKEQLSKRDDLNIYKDKLKDLNNFAKQLMKLCQNHQDHEDAFTPEQQAKLKMIADNLEYFVFIRQNKDIYGTTSEIGSNSTKLKQLVEIITDALIAVNYSKS